MTKLKLKRTAEEEAQHQARKERRRERKRKHERSQASTSKRHRTDQASSRPARKWGSSDEESDSRNEEVQADIEERIFREKMFDAMEDDERLDGLEAEFNHFTHVPDRWMPSKGEKGARAGMYEGDEYLRMDPNGMDDEEYVEWIRMGMYRKTHAEEYANEQRKKAEHRARKAEEKARKAETKRLEKLEEGQRKRRKEEGLEIAREKYNSRWVALLGSVGEGGELGFRDIPWPVVDAYRHPERLRVESFSGEAICSFLLGGKEEMREAIRRFHPDKFEGRLMHRVRKQEQERVREGIGQVSRVLMAERGNHCQM